MSNQADVRSIDAIRGFRVALALFAEDALAALGAVDMEAKRTVQWVQHDRRAYWQEQIKRRREQVAMAKAEVFRRKLAKTDDYTPGDERAERDPPQGRGQPPGRRAPRAPRQEVGDRASSRPSSNTTAAPAGSATWPAATSPAPSPSSNG